MDLISYATSKGGTGKPGCPILNEVAVGSGCSADTLYLIARGHKTPGAKLSNRIEQATAGQVPRAVLRPDYFGEDAAVAPSGDAGITKRALRARLGMNSDARLAKLLRLPVDQVAAWPEEEGVPALPQVMQLLGVQQPPAATQAAPEDPDAGRIITVEAA